MPAPALLAPLIMAGANVTSQGLNAVSTGVQNRAQRKWNEKMYHWQRRDSLADWTMQNNYNSPEAQMARLRSAGLNPNLVYSNGATQTADAVRSSDTGSYRPQPIQFDLGSAAAAGLGAYYDMQIKDATIENLKQQGANLQADNLLKKAQTLATTAQAGKTTVDQKTTEFDLYMKNQLKNFSYEASRLGVEKQKADIAFTLDQNERARLSNNASLQENAIRILLMRRQASSTEATTDEIRARIEQIKRDTQLKQLDIQLRQMGVNSSDPLYQRVIGQLLNGDITPFKQGWEKFKSWFK